MAQMISQPSITEKLTGRYIDAMQEVLRANPRIELTQLRPMAERAWVSALDILVKSERIAERGTQQRQNEKRAARSRCRSLDASDGGCGDLGVRQAKDGPRRLAATAVAARA